MIYDKIIGIGHSCVPAYQIRRNFGQQEAYFFDWLVMPPSALVSIIKKGLISLFCKEKFVIYEQAGTSATYVPVVQKELNIIFYHDFRKSFGLLDYDQVLKKYSFLADRWNQLMQGGKKILFIRHHIKKDECVETYEAIRSTYFSLDFKILAVNECDPNTLLWNIDGIYSYYIKSSNSWHGDNNEWLRVFREMKIK